MEPLIDLDRRISESFTWREALWLRQWGFAVIPTLEQQRNIIEVALKLELIRDIFAKQPIRITSWLRPEPYNRLIRGAPSSPHVEGKAVDFQILGVHPAMVRRVLEKRLDELLIRMEMLPDDAPWIHIDTREPGPSGKRYFEP